MTEIVAMCGIACSECPAYLATQNDDNGARAKCAAMWSSASFPLQPADIECDGCPTRDGRVLSFCLACPVRQCALEREVENCASCDDYACDKLEQSWKVTEGTAAKANLDKIRAQRDL